MDVKYSLEPIFTDIVRFGAEGFQRQFDLCDDKYEIAIECKNVKGISWNELQKYYEKLESVAPQEYSKFVVFHTLRQPVLVFHKFFDTSTASHQYSINTFESVFGIAFVKHKSTRFINT
jgi:hypothetical protein